MRVIYALMGESTTLISQSDVIVRAEAQMPDLFTSPALLILQKQRVSRLVI
jgi:hypothetical protein